MWQLPKEGPSQGVQEEPPATPRPEPPTITCAHGQQKLGALYPGASGRGPPFHVDAETAGEQSARGRIKPAWTGKVVAGTERTGAGDSTFQPGAAARTPRPCLITEGGICLRHGRTGSPEHLVPKTQNPPFPGDQNLLLICISFA